MDSVGLSRKAWCVCPLSQRFLTGNFDSSQFPIDLLALDLKPPKVGLEPYLGGLAQQQEISVSVCGDTGLT